MIVISSYIFLYLIRLSSSLAHLLDIFNAQNKKSDSPKTNTINTTNINHFQNGIISPHFQIKKNRNSFRKSILYLTLLASFITALVYFISSFLFLNPQVIA